MNASIEITHCPCEKHDVRIETDWQYVLGQNMHTYVPPKKCFESNEVFFDVVWKVGGDGVSI